MTESRIECVRTLTLEAQDYFSDYGETVTTKLHLMSDGTVKWEKTNLGGWNGWE